MKYLLFLEFREINRNFILVHQEFSFERKNLFQVYILVHILLTNTNLPLAEPDAFQHINKFLFIKFNKKSCTFYISASFFSIVV